MQKDVKVFTICNLHHKGKYVCKIHVPREVAQKKLFYYL